MNTITCGESETAKKVGIGIIIGVGGFLNQLLHKGKNYDQVNL